MTTRERRLYAFFAVAYFAQGLAGFAYEPVEYLLKDVLHLGPAQAAIFIAWMTLPLTIKPLFGVFTDFLPLDGRRRVPHMVGVSLITVAGWACLAYFKNYRYFPTLALLALVNVGYVLSDIVCDGVMVERGQKSGKTGLYQAVQIGTLYASLILTGLGGGWLTTHASYKTIFMLAAILPMLPALAVLWIEEPVAFGVSETAARGWSGLKTLARDPRAWAVAVVIFLWDFCPFLGTAQFYYQSGALNLSPQFIGALSTVGGISGVAGAALFGRWSARAGATETIARLSVTCGGVLSLLYLLYLGPASAMLLTVVFSVTGVIFRLAWMDLAARACPEGAEATSFAVFMAVFNIAAAASNWVGGLLYETISLHSGPFAALAVLTMMGTACTFACWPLLRVALPKP